MLWLLHLLGIDDTSGRWYGFWSGFGSDLGEVHRCWRLGRHATSAGHSVCRKHHPDGHLTGDAVVAAHKAAAAKPDLGAQLAVHCADLKEHISAAADARVSAGAGGNPAGAGLPADQRVVPPAAAARANKTRVKP